MTASPPAFDAVLTPSRSLSARGFFVLIAAVSAINLAIAIKFWMHGAWLVVPFLGLDVLAVFVAFHLSYRSGRQVEHVRLDEKALTVSHREPSGATRTWSFEPAWARVSLLPKGRDGHRLTIMSHGKGVEIADFLSPGERESLAEALAAALRAQRGVAPGRPA